MSYYIIQVCRQLSSSSILVLLKSCLETVWHIPLLSVQWINSWWWTEEMSETCRFSCQNKFVKLVHLVGFIIKKQSLPVNLFSDLLWFSQFWGNLCECLLERSGPGSVSASLFCADGCALSVSLITYLFSRFEMIVCHKIWFSKWFSCNCSVLEYNLRALPAPNSLFKCLRFQIRFTE